MRPCPYAPRVQAFKALTASLYQVFGSAICRQTIQKPISIISSHIFQMAHLRRHTVLGARFAAAGLSKWADLPPELHLLIFGKAVERVVSANQFVCMYCDWRVTNFSTQIRRIFGINMGGMHHLHATVLVWVEANATKRTCCDLSTRSLKCQCLTSIGTSNTANGTAMRICREWEFWSPCNLLLLDEDDSQRYRTVSAMRLVCRNWKKAIDASLFGLALPADARSDRIPLFLRFPELQRLNLGNTGSAFDDVRDNPEYDQRLFHRISKISSLQKLRSLILHLPGCAVTFAA